MWVCFDLMERTICGLATVAGERGTVVGIRTDSEGHLYHVVCEF